MFDTENNGNSGTYFLNRVRVSEELLVVLMVQMVEEVSKTWWKTLPILWKKNMMIIITVMKIQQKVSKAVTLKIWCVKRTFKWFLKLYPILGPSLILLLPHLPLLPLVCITSWMERFSVVRVARISQETLTLLNAIYVFILALNLNVIIAIMRRQGKTP